MIDARAMMMTVQCFSMNPPLELEVDRDLGPTRLSPQRFGDFRPPQSAGRIARWRQDGAAGRIASLPIHQPGQTGSAAEFVTFVQPTATALDREPFGKAHVRRQYRNERQGIKR